MVPYRTIARSWENRNTLIEQSITLTEHCISLIQIMHIIKPIFLPVHCYPHHCSIASQVSIPKGTT